MIPCNDLHEISRGLIYSFHTFPPSGRLGAADEGRYVR